MKRVFLSSTAKDLHDFREKVYHAIEGMDGFHCVRMEDFGARDSDAQKFCPEKISECDVFVCLAGLCHGSSPSDSEHSYTEIEYEHASESDIPCLIFMSAEDHFYEGYFREPDEKWQKQQNFRAQVSRERILDSFTQPDELATKVIKALRNW
jgi:hypothetical protein